MADAATADGSLKNEFNFNSLWGGVEYVWGLRHKLMDLSMIGFAVSGLVAAASGGASIGWFDPVLAWLKMHVSGLGGFLELGDFAEAAMNSGDLVTENGLTDLHGAEHTHGVDEACMKNTFNSLTTEDFAAQKALADNFGGGDFYGQLEGMCHE